MRFTVSEPPAFRLPGSSNSAPMACLAASGSSLFPGTLPTLSLGRLPFVFKVLAFPFSSVCSGELYVGRLGTSIPWVCALGVRHCQPQSGSFHPYTTEYSHPPPHPTQETALTSRAAPPAAAGAGSLELGSPDFCDQLVGIGQGGGH